MNYRTGLSIALAFVFIAFVGCGDSKDAPVTPKATGPDSTKSFPTAGASAGGAAPAGAKKDKASGGNAKAVSE